jgi:hypothetical protein
MIKKQNNNFLLLFLLVIIVVFIIIYFITSVQEKYETKIQRDIARDKVVSVKFYDSIDADKTNTKKTNIGICFSGGGARAASSTVGVLQSLLKNNMLSNDKIDYLSGNSGSTWILLPVLYQKYGTNVDIRTILGTYTPPTTKNFNDSIPSSEIGSKLLDNDFTFTVWSNFWVDAVGNSFFMPYMNLSTSFPYYYRVNIAGPNDQINHLVDISNKLENTNWVTKGTSPKPEVVINRVGLPIPITISSLISVDPTKGLAKEFIPIDSTPYSTGFLRPSTSNVLSGRVENYGFLSIPQSSDNLTANVTIPGNIWNQVLMSGSSSNVLVPNNTTRSYTDQYSILNKAVISSSDKNQKFYIGDGYLIDDSSIISLVSRKMQKIVAVLNYQVFSDKPAINNYVFIIGGDYQRKIGKVTTINDSNCVVEFNENNIPIQATISYNYINIFDLNNINSLFHPTYGIFEGSSKDILENMYNNYNNEGFFYTIGTFNVKNVEKYGITSYKCEILWYLLTSSWSFYNILPDNNKNVYNNIIGAPNVCTIAATTSDCTFTSNCKKPCINPNDILNTVKEHPEALTTINKITNREFNVISTLSGWFTENKIIPFINSS